MFENIPVDKIGFSNKRQSNLEYLGSDMIEGGNEFGAGTPYGKIGFWLWRNIQQLYLERLKINE